MAPAGRRRRKLAPPSRSGGPPRGCAPAARRDVPRARRRGRRAHRGRRHHRVGPSARGAGTARSRRARLDVARFDGATLQLPPVLDVLPDVAGNTALYEWLAVWVVHAAEPPRLAADPPHADIPRVRAAGPPTAPPVAAY